MKFTDWEQIKQLRKLLATDRREPSQQAARIVAMQRDIVLPAKAGIVLVGLYYLFYSGWFYEVPTTRSVLQELLKNFFLIYILCNVVASVVLGFWRRFPPAIFQWVAFTLGLLDGLFMAGLAIVTGGFDSVVFWVFPGLIVLNALTIPLAMPQIVLNLIVSLFYLSAGLLDPHIAQEQTAMISVPGRSIVRLHATNRVEQVTSPDTILLNLEPLNRTRRAFWSDDLGGQPVQEDPSPDIFLLRVAMLWLLTLCCYGAQVLWERQRVALAEADEFAARENQLHSAGRLAAEFAHQIKNPLAVINNAAFSLRRSLQNNNASAAGQQIDIIREEVARADRVITQIMGYAQLSEGRVEKLDLVEKVNSSIEQVFPAAVPTKIKVRKELNGHYPPLLMQRGHLSEILVNLLLNAREALGQKGTVLLTAACLPDNAVEISVSDDGPGIPPAKLEQVFEAYFTTKEKGTGLGLAIVRHNAELYGGTVRVESELGKGAKFTVTLPAKAMPKPSPK
jgi:signal transduction histidine kinase